jgi:hypothetical protein
MILLYFFLMKLDPQIKFGGQAFAHPAIGHAELTIKKKIKNPGLREMKWESSLREFPSFFTP